MKQETKLPQVESDGVRKRLGKTLATLIVGAGILAAQSGCQTYCQGGPHHYHSYSSPGFPPKNPSFTNFKY